MKSQKNDAITFMIWFLSLSILVVAIFLSSSSLLGTPLHSAQTSNVSQLQKEVPPEQSSAQNNLININQATLVELQTLNGIGEKTANEIIYFREKMGGFSDISQLMNVKGIGQKKFDAIKHLIKI